MPSYDFVYSFMVEHFEDVKVRGNQFKARCALCGDSAKSKRKARFNLKYDDKSTVYHCFNCNDAGSFYKLYSIVKGMDINSAYGKCESIGSVFGTFLNDSIFDKNLFLKPPPPTLNFNRITKDCFTEYNSDPGMIYESYVEVLKKFRRDRRISSNIPLFIAYKGEYKGRIIIPVYNVDGDIIYFQARRTIESIQPKYLNPDFPKEIVIPNFDFFDSNKPVVIVEGLLDCYSIGKQSTTCLGLELEDEFIKRVRSKCREAIIALDNDIEGKKATAKIIKSSRYNRELKYFIMPYKNIKDINELLVKTSAENINIYEFIIDNSYNYLNYLLKSEDCNETNNTGKRCYKH